MDPKLINKLKGSTVLLIEDNEFVRSALQMAFAISGCMVQPVATAEEGLAALGRAAFDVIVCDYRLPGMDGLEFFRRAKSRTPTSIKVLMSAYGFSNAAAAAKNVGVHAMFEKPFPIQRLLTEVFALKSRTGRATTFLSSSGSLCVS